MAFPPNFTNSWDTTFPPDTELANLIGANLRQLRTDVMQRISLLSGTFVNRPTPETINASWGGAGYGLLYFSTDTNQIFQWNGAVWNDVTSNIGGGGRFGFIGVNIIPVTVANTVAFTVMQTMLIPANTLTAGQTYYVDLSGTMGANGAPSLVYQLFIDGVLLSSVTPTAGSITQSWTARAFFTCTVTGAAGRITNPVLHFWNSLVTSLPGVVTPGLIAVDTTINHTLQTFAQWGAASPNNTITENAMTVYRIG